MANRKVLICDTVDVASLALSEDFEVDYLPKITPEELLEKVANYDVVVVRSRTKIDSSVIERAARLKLIARPGTGLDNVDLRAANAKGIEVVNSPEALVEAVAEQVVGLMLALARKTPSADASTRSGRWEKERFVGVELRGRTVGIAGMGRIGRRVGEIAKVLGMSVLGYDIIEISRDVLTSIGCTMVDLDTLFSSSDFVTLHVPLSPETRHLVDSRRLSLMKKGSFLVNTSRGEVIDGARPRRGALGRDHRRSRPRRLRDGAAKPGDTHRAQPDRDAAHRGTDHRGAEDGHHRDRFEDSAVLSAARIAKIYLLLPKRGIRLLCTSEIGKTWHKVFHEKAGDISAQGRPAQEGADHREAGEAVPARPGKDARVQGQGGRGRGQDQGLQRRDEEEEAHLGRRPKHLGVLRMKSDEPVQGVAERQGPREVPEPEAPRLLHLWQDGKHSWFECILIDPLNPSISSDYNYRRVLGLN